MSDLAIRVDNLGKRYRIGPRQHYATLRDKLVDAVRKPWRWLRDLVGWALPTGVTVGSAHPTRLHNAEAVESNRIWALRDVSFEVPRGEVVGIIGRNGAGKSTLLKVLSQITEPTEGEVELTGRVGSLLEVGTGFHPELTGRENIFLNGAILGMKRHEIVRKFDDIAAFAEVEQFLDTPVKHYSSGMYMRLAFAVAAHLEPEILIVDEVLAVGDAEFQKKCLGKMDEVASEGRTVLFVSHNMTAVQALCRRVVVLRNGTLHSDGFPAESIRQYVAETMAEGSQNGVADLTHPGISRKGSGAAQFTRIELIAETGEPSSVFQFGEPMRVRLSIHAKARVDEVLLGFSFVSAEGIELMGTTASDGGVRGLLEPGMNIFQCHVKPMPLTPGLYYVRAAVFKFNEVFDHVDELIQFSVDTSPYVHMAPPARHHVGHVYLPYEWLRET